MPKIKINKYEFVAIVKIMEEAQADAIKDPERHTDAEDYISDILTELGIEQG